MDPCWVCRLVVDGQEWLSVEHYCQSSRFTDDDRRRAIQVAAQPQRRGGRAAAAEHGQLLARAVAAAPDQDDALDVAFSELEALYVATRIKFEQNLVLRQQLLETRGRVEAAEACGDAVWRRLHGCVLERVREELRPELERDGPALEALLAECRAQGGLDERRAAERLEAARAAFGAHLRKISVLKMSGTGYELYMHPSDTIKVLREQVAFLMGLSASRLILLNDQQRLEDEQTIDGCDLQEDAQLTVVISSPLLGGGACHRVLSIREDLHNEFRLLAQRG
eukprot:SRR837773.2467.p1 GENE.SRR837773.2467~~SRR837773.2467.p1  ORF type:complete len:311 (+),score=109.04 SRR837773.2467:91-933(+)